MKWTDTVGVSCVCMRECVCSPWVSLARCCFHIRLRPYLSLKMHMCENRKLQLVTVTDILNSWEVVTRHSICNSILNSPRQIHSLWHTDRNRKINKSQFTFVDLLFFMWRHGFIELLAGRRPFCWFTYSSPL